MGTFAGVVDYLRSENPHLRAFLVQPQGSYLLGESGKHLVEGIGADGPETTALLDESVVERVVRVTDREAHDALHELMRSEGLLAGGSSGAAAHAAREIARELGPRAHVVTLFPDGAERYVSQGILGPFEGWKR
jgi:cysteine synthase